MSKNPYESEAQLRLRDVCMALPETVDKPFGGHNAPTYRVNDKMYVNSSEDGLSIILKGAPGVQKALVAASPERYFVPKYVGHIGWFGVNLTTELDWEELAELIEESYRLIAPKKLVALLDKTS